MHVLRHAVASYPTASELWLRLLEELPREFRTPPGLGSAALAQVAPEVRDGEGDPAALAGVDEALLEQRVAGRRERLRLLAEGGGDVGAEYGVALGLVAWSAATSAIAIR